MAFDYNNLVLTPKSDEKQNVEAVKLQSKCLKEGVGKEIKVDSLEPLERVPKGNNVKQNRNSGKIIESPSESKSASDVRSDISSVNLESDVVSNDKNKGL